MTEIWKDIPNYEGLYQASNLGRFKSLEKTIKHSYGSTAHNKERLLKLELTKNGYNRVTLSKDGVVKRFLAHRLIWETFNGPIPEGMQCNHINEITTDNRLENINLMTCRENLNYGNHNRKVALSMVNNPKICRTVKQYDLEGSFIKEYPSISEAARQMGCNVSNIRSCCLGKYKQAKGYVWSFA